MRLLSLLSLLAASALSLVSAQPNPGLVTGNTAVADPTICRDSAGTYFVFCAYSSSAVRYP